MTTNGAECDTGVAINDSTYKISRPLVLDIH